MAKKKKRAKKPQNTSSSSFASSSMAEQLAKSKLSQKLKKKAAADARQARRPPKPKPSEPLPPEQMLDGEELFMAALEAMPAPSKRQKSRGTSAFHGAFAKQLQGHTPIEDRREPELEKAPEEFKKTQEKQSLKSDLSGLEGESLFEHALNTMQPADLFAGKYHGSVKNLPRPKKPDPFSVGNAPSSPKRSKSQRRQDEAQAREQVAELREEMLFTRAVGQLDEVFSNHDKYHRQKPKQYGEREERTGYASESPEGLITPPLPKSGEGLNRVDALDPAHRGLLNRAKLWARKNHLESLNIRGDGVEDALRQVELFVHQQWKDGATYVRIVHGRGLQSEEGIPVLKPSVLHWLEGPGFRYVRGYAPELTQDHDYGSIIVCLTRRTSGKDK